MSKCSQNHVHCAVFGRMFINLEGFIQPVYLDQYYSLFRFYMVRLIYSFFFCEWSSYFPNRCSHHQGRIHMALPGCGSSRGRSSTDATADERRSVRDSLASPRQIPGNLFKSWMNMGLIKVINHGLRWIKRDQPWFMKHLWIHQGTAELEAMISYDHDEVQLGSRDLARAHQP